jgi:hypothetical protein
MNNREEEEIKRLIKNFGITIFGAVLKAEAKEHGTKNTAWNVVSAIGQDMQENPDSYRTIIEDIIKLYEQNKQ